jgi:uncharacterized protein YndB with AHSA1/START domain
MLKTLLFIVAAAVALVLVIAATKPDTFRVERSIVINAPPEKVHALINDMHAFNTWNPWAKKDPGMKGSYSGPANGKGAAYAWDSDKVGTGRMEIVDTAPASSVKIKLDFTKPFEAHNMVDFTLAPEAGATRVTWSMSGPANFISKLMQVFMSMDKMVGHDFEDGLASMKTIAESR